MAFVAGRADFGGAGIGRFVRFGSAIVEVVSDVVFEMADSGDVGGVLVGIFAVLLEHRRDDTSDFESDLRGPIRFGRKNGQGRSLVGDVGPRIRAALQNFKSGGFESRID